MLALIFDPRFKNIWLVTSFLGCENVIFVDYNQNLILPLLIEANKDVDACPIPILLKLTIYNFKVVFKIFFRPQQHPRNLTRTLCQES
jgi:hypothetical protein